MSRVLGLVLFSGVFWAAAALVHLAALVSLVPFRLGIPAEVTVLTLRAA